MTDTDKLLDSLFDDAREDFERHRPIMAFKEFVNLFLEQPERHGRNSVQYLRDCFSHFGTQKKEELNGNLLRFRLFDAEFSPRRDGLVGQEHVQAKVYRLLENFVREGRINKLILLHGPNGSAKSTFVKTMMRGMEAYSNTNEGALYRFNWVFPNERMATGASIGFGGVAVKAVDSLKLDTFAFLNEEEIDAKIVGEMNDHPLLLLPTKQREALIKAAMQDNDADDDDFAVSDYLRFGELSHTSRQIFDALLAAYKGDLSKVLKHVQIERFYISRRYRAGAVTVEPQMRVDAGLRQLTADRSLAALPSSLQNQTIIEPFGDLVDANRGVIEYDDFFKRHPDLNRYLLATGEKGTVSVDNRILHLDTVLIATANEDYLEAYKQTPDYASFKGRVEFVRMPYILDYLVEASIYDDLLSTVAHLDHVAPHATQVAALWAVLTRLKRPKADLYPKTLREAVTRISPLEKAELYAKGKAPESLPMERANELRALIPEMMDESDGTSFYEGRMGASPREMKMVLMNASQHAGTEYLSPQAIFSELELLIKDPSVYKFLQLKPDGDYWRHENFINTVRERYLDVVNDEVLDAMGLIEAKQYDEFFSRYIEHVSQSLKKEKIYNRITGKHEDPDESFMVETEALMGAAERDATDFRSSLISSIAAFSIDHPGAPMEYKVVFPGFFQAMRKSFFEERTKTTGKILETALVYFEDGPSGIPADELAPVETMMEGMTSRYGYREDSAREAVAFLFTSRYKG